MAIRPDPDRCPEEAFAPCPSCALVTPVRAVDPDVDPARPRFVVCACCGQSYQLRPAELLPLDEVGTCPSCGVHTACPRDAAQVRCRACGELFVGPHADPAVVREVQAGQVRRAIEFYRDIGDRLGE